MGLYQGFGFGVCRLVSDLPYDISAASDARVISVRVLCVVTHSADELEGVGVPDVPPDFVVVHSDLPAKPSPWSASTRSWM